MTGDSFSLWFLAMRTSERTQPRADRRLADALPASEQGGDGGGPPFHWDIAIDIGDMSGGQDLPDDEEGEVVRRFRSGKTSAREDVCNIAAITIAAVCLSRRPGGGRNGLIRWGPTRRAFPALTPAAVPIRTTGTWERYSFTVGNVLFLLMSDINEPSQTVGRGTLGGNPAGVVTGETFAWWREQVETHPDHIIVSAHHYMLKNTTVASGDWEGKAGRRRSLAESLPRL